MDISSMAGASDVFGLTGSAAVVAWVAIQTVKLTREWLLAREGKQVEQRAVRVDDETKVIKLNGTKCDSHKMLEANIAAVVKNQEEAKVTMKEFSNKLDLVVDKLFDRVREVENAVGLVEKDVAVLQAKG